MSYISTTHQIFDEGFAIYKLSNVPVCTTVYICAIVIEVYIITDIECLYSESQRIKVAKASQ